MDQPEARGFFLEVTGDFGGPSMLDFSGFVRRNLRSRTPFTALRKGRHRWHAGCSFATAVESIEEDDRMVAMMTPTKEPLRLTQENHPENAVTAATSSPTGLAATIFLSCLCGLIGLVFGSAALSTAFMADTPYELLSVLPLILLAVCILGGWVGAFFWMVREEAIYPAI
jgi:hypothetical protein